MPAATAPVSAHVPARTWIAIIAATLGAFMAILNIQIVNASLADIQGAIGADIGGCGVVDRWLKRGHDFLLLACRGRMH